MSALGEGPHIVGIDTARGLPEGDACGIAHFAIASEPEA
jgi:hypothetical protein